MSGLTAAALSGLLLGTCTSQYEELSRTFQLVSELETLSDTWAAAITRSTSSHMLLVTRYFRQILTS